MADIFTVRGMLDEAGLTYQRIIIDNDTEYTVRDEWHAADGVLVRSDVHVTLKQAPAPLSIFQENVG